MGLNLKPRTYDGLPCFTRKLRRSKEKICSKFRNSEKKTYTKLLLTLCLSFIFDVWAFGHTSNEWCCIFNRVFQCIQYSNEVFQQYSKTSNLSIWIFLREKWYIHVSSRYLLHRTSELHHGDNHWTKINWCPYALCYPLFISNVSFQNARVGIKLLDSRDVTNDKLKQPHIFKDSFIKFHLAFNIIFWQYSDVLW